ncbi:hypothetical protein Z517_03723 [Fonsecaea pedrosoi CBS 271.37]|uniref:Unplaced genomic scaffold supercont1.2, whole genome shotgun sequence n=1 Tax=Fonsecaea pedrosoi CBS 271.37 TaxID=1442368 RepID=A0A0D2GTX7_9EURO|nr:uncharacterized protein Z517_03723 [Fonsecaea pedrosoi CBS 271.37]KIW84473.1 hypothetical protein Z517_03723 [Fonsecaea pedrosoi CBS 271.37]
MVTLEEFLDRRNPDIDSSNILSGPNTVSIHYSNLGGVEEWGEFNYTTLRNLYGEILDRTLLNPPDNQIPTELEAEIWDERQFELLFSQYMLTSVRYALRQAYDYCDKSWECNPPGEFFAPIDPGAGGRAKRPKDSDNPRFRPDWSFVRRGYMTSTTPKSYINLCPGDTKLGVKWKHEWHRTDFKTWKVPAEQIQTYSDDHWNVRYVGSGLSTTRSLRTAASTLGHARVASDETDLSSLMTPLSITTHSYRDDPPNVEYQPIKAKFIPWTIVSKGLNVKKALFMLFMLAGAPGGPKLVQTDYPPLDSWWPEGSVFRHNSTGKVSNYLQPTTLLSHPSGEVADPTTPVEEPRRRGAHEERASEVASGSGNEQGRGKRRRVDVK